jgi:tRNA (guanine-N7-)-methyltransferase
LLETPDSSTPMAIDWPSVFGNDRPVELEIGSGKGGFLLTAAQARPDVNFVGVEIERKYQLYTATRLAKRELTNVRVVKADARQWLRDAVAPASIQAIHVYFPDPWWKRRHLKRRIFTADFFVHCQRILRPGGQLRFATDVEAYFDLAVGLVGEHTRLSPAAEPMNPSALADADYLTNYERKFRNEGRPIFRATYLRYNDAEPQSEQRGGPHATEPGGDFGYRA